MIKTIKILFLIILVILFSCEEQSLLIKCDECVEDEPLKTFLAVRLSQNTGGTVTMVNVYEGNLGDNVLYTSFDISGISESMTVLVTLNKKYTITASYTRKGNNYIAVDSATPKVKYYKEQCDVPCYYVYDRDVDLRLKYTK